MYLKNIYVSHFRNYDDFQISFQPSMNIIYGNNAQGKTNLLEAIYVLGMTKSHRSFIDNTLIQKNESTAYLKGTVVFQEQSETLELGISKTKKLLKIDHNEIKKMSDYISHMNLIIFYPEDLDLIKGGPALRRRFMNLELSQLYATYLDVLNDYNKLLKMRNDCLKQYVKGEYVDESYLSILDQYFTNKAELIYRMRKKFVDKLTQYVPEIFEDISGLTGFSLNYHTNIDLSSQVSYQEQLLEKLKKHHETEKRLGVTLVGPHKDDLEFFLNGNHLKLYGSQGQQRMAVLALKLAEIHLFQDYKKETPILLLDDVFSELDFNKRNNLLKHINHNTQTIITTTELELLDTKLIENASLIHIHDGKLISKDEV